MACASGDSLLAELDCLRQKLAEVERERDAYKIAHQLVSEECSHWASERTKHRDFLAKYIEVATEREQELGLRCAALESRLQMAQRQGVAEKAANELFDRETLDEIGLVFQELYAEAGKDYDQHCDEHSVRPDGPAPKWNDYVRNVFEQLIERGLLIPRAEHEAAIAAVVATQHEPKLNVGEREGTPWTYITCKCGWDEQLAVPWDTDSWIRHIRSVTTQSAQDALREAKAGALSNALDQLWELMRDGWETQKAMDKVKLMQREVGGEGSDAPDKD